MLRESKGLKVEPRNIPFSPPDITDSEIEEVVDTLKSGWITTGPKTKLLEKKLQNFVGRVKLYVLLHKQLVQK